MAYWCILWNMQDTNQIFWQRVRFPRICPTKCNSQLHALQNLKPNWRLHKRAHDQRFSHPLLWCTCSVFLCLYPLSLRNPDSSATSEWDVLHVYATSVANWQISHECPKTKQPRQQLKFIQTHQKRIKGSDVWSSIINLYDRTEICNHMQPSCNHVCCSIHLNRLPLLLSFGQDHLLWEMNFFHFRSTQDPSGIMDSSYLRAALFTRWLVCDIGCFHMIGDLFDQAKPRPSVRSCLRQVFLDCHNVSPHCFSIPWRRCSRMIPWFIGIDTQCPSTGRTLQNDTSKITFYKIGKRSLQFQSAWIQRLEANLSGCPSWKSAWLLQMAFGTYRHHQSKENQGRSLHPRTKGIEPTVEWHCVHCCSCGCCWHQPPRRALSTLIFGYAAFSHENSSPFSLVSQASSVSAAQIHCLRVCHDLRLLKLLVGLCLLWPLELVPSISSMQALLPKHHRKLYSILQWHCHCRLVAARLEQQGITMDNASQKRLSWGLPWSMICCLFFHSKSLRWFDHEDFINPKKTHNITHYKAIVLTRSLTKTKTNENYCWQKMSYWQKKCQLAHLRRIVRNPKWPPKIPCARSKLWMCCSISKSAHPPAAMDDCELF